MKGFLHSGRNDNAIMSSRAQSRDLSTLVEMTTASCHYERSLCHFEPVEKSHLNSHLAYKTQNEGIF